MGKNHDEVEKKALVALQEEGTYAANEWEQGDKTLEDYLALPDDVRVELIDGVFYDMASPSLAHQDIAAEIWDAFRSHIKKNGGACRAFMSPADVQLDCDNKTIVQPDVFIVCNGKKLRKNRLFGCPDLAVEVISPSTRKKDVDLKKRKYKNAGVREYWLVFPKERGVLVYLFGEEDEQKIYSFEDEIPVGIWNGECKVNFRDILESAETLMDLEA